ncbi:hypothetical protein OQA88_1495 [Cercophora sp. LCS_1]
MANFEFDHESPRQIRETKKIERDFKIMAYVGLAFCAVAPWGGTLGLACALVASVFAICLIPFAGTIMAFAGGVKIFGISLSTAFYGSLIAMLLIVLYFALRMYRAVVRRKNIAYDDHSDCWCGGKGAVSRRK